jgi:hypothetical protein
MFPDAQIPDPAAAIEAGQLAAAPSR